MQYLLPGRIDEWLWKQCCGTIACVTDLLFPQVCVVCDESLVSGEHYLCTSCLADFPLTIEGYEGSQKILECFEISLRPERLHALFYYNKFDAYKNLIYQVKYHSYRKLGKYLGYMLGEHIAGTCRADCIIPIPLHPKREKKRGFNQAFEIARGVSAVLGIEILDDVVYRVRNNVSQTGKNATERLKNVENIFELRKPWKVIGRHVLLLDDVITTGATIGACLKVVSQAGNVRFSLGCLAQTI